MSKGRRVSELEEPESTDGGTDEHVSQPPLSGVHEGEKGRGSGRWTVAEQFVRDGFHYRVMRRPLDTDESARLTRREEEALFHASTGASNKRIAQLLSVAPSTVGVLLFRAASKLGVKNRQELLSAYARLAQRSNDDNDVAPDE